MPIKPENWNRYPANWKAISSQAKRDALWRCEECEVAHGELGYRYPKPGGDWRPVDQAHSVAVTQALVDLRGPRARLTRIVLTVHHLDAQPENNAPSNLAALCQRCHLRADALLRKARAAEQEPSHA